MADRPPPEVSQTVTGEDPLTGDLNEAAADDQAGPTSASPFDGEADAGPPGAPSESDGDEALHPADGEGDTASGPDGENSEAELLDLREQRKRRTRKAKGPQDPTEVEDPTGLHRRDGPTSAPLPQDPW